jgi:hypothetical protein
MGYDYYDTAVYNSRHPCGQVSGAIRSLQSLENATTQVATKAQRKDIYFAIIYLKG